MIAFRDDAHVRSQVRGPIRPDGEGAARRYLRDHPREETPGWLWMLVAGLVLVGVLLA